MIEITVLKVHHGGDTAEEGDTEARKLVPYLQHSDIFGPEQAGSTEQNAREMENIWESFLSTNTSRTAVQRFIKDMYSGSNAGNLAYNIQFWDYLFCNKKLVWGVERFTPSESERIDRFKTTSRHYDHGAQWSFRRGEIDEYIRIIRGQIDTLEAGAKERDQHIARNLVEAEQRIRSRYPQLKDQDPLGFTLELGHRHFPERYYAGEINVVDLAGNSERLTDRIHHARENEQEAEERRLILAYGLYKIGLLPEKLVADLSYGELVDRIKEHIRK